MLNGGLWICGKKESLCESGELVDSREVGRSWAARFLRPCWRRLNFIERRRSGRRPLGCDNMPAWNRYAKDGALAGTFQFQLPLNVGDAPTHAGKTDARGRFAGAEIFQHRR